MGSLVDIGIGAGIGVFGAYLFTHPANRAALLSRFASLAKQEWAWVLPILKKLFTKQK